MPYQIMKELYVETGYLLSKNEIKSQQTLSVKLIGWWWALWIFSNVFSQTIMRFEHKAEGIDELINITILSMIDNVIAIPLALITIKVIENYSKVEHLLNKVD